MVTGHSGQALTGYGVRVTRCILSCFMACVFAACGCSIHVTGCELSLWLKLQREKAKMLFLSQTPGFVFTTWGAAFQFLQESDREMINWNSSILCLKPKVYKKKKNCLRVGFDLATSWSWVSHLIHSATQDRVSWLGPNISGYFPLCLETLRPLPKCMMWEFPTCRPSANPFCSQLQFWRIPGDFS